MMDRSLCILTGNEYMDTNTAVVQKSTYTVLSVKILVLKSG